MKPTRKEMKDVLQHPDTDAATRERYIIMYREAFMNDLRGMLAAWGDCRKPQANRLLQESNFDIKLTITNIITEFLIDGGNKVLPGPRRGDAHPGAGD